MGNSSARMRRDGARSLIVMALASVSALALNGPAFAQSTDETSRAATPSAITTSPLNRFRPPCSVSPSNRTCKFYSHRKTSQA
jgi:hypothetical protein